MTNIEMRQGESPTAHSIIVGPLILVFSYETCVAFAVSGEGWVVSENIWSKTTGKHLNQEVGFIPKSQRIPNEEFRRRLGIILDRVTVAA